MPSEIAADLRASPATGKPERLREELAASVHRLVLRVMQKRCAPHGAGADAEDGAQELALKLFERIAEGEVPPRPGEEEPYLQRCARHRAVDILKGKGVYQHRKYGEFAQEDVEATNDVATLEAEAELARHREVVREVVGALHETYREVIEAHDFRGVPLTEIADQWLAQGRATTLAKARQNVQKAHSNAVKRLRALVLARLEEEQR